MANYSSSDYARNTAKLQAVKAIHGIGVGFISPVLTIFFLGKGLSLAEFMILMGILNIAITVFEVPTGIFADRISRKYSVMIGETLVGLALTMMILGSHFWFFVLAFILFALGESFFSGADEALLYDSVKAAGIESQAQKHYGRLQSTFMLATVAGSLASGVVVHFASLAAPFWIAAAATPFKVLVLLLVREPPLEVSAADGDAEGGAFAAYIEHIKQTIRHIFTNRQILTLAVLKLTLTRFFMSLQRPFAQPYMLSFGYKPSQLGYFYALFSVVSAITSRFSHRITASFGRKERRLYGILPVAALAVLSVFTFPRFGWILVLSIVGAYFVNGLMLPAVLAGFNKRVDSERRAACMSLTSMGNHLLGFIVGPLYGYASDALGLGAGVKIFGLSYGVLLVAVLVLILKFIPRLKNDSNQEN